MAEHHGKENAEAKEPKPKKPIEYKRFEKLLKRVIKSPPLSNKEK